jgi:hypothetical protein
MIAFYTMSLSMKTSKMPYFVDSTDTIIEKIVVTMRTAMKIEEKAGLKGLLVFSIIPRLKRWFANKESELL